MAKLLLLLPACAPSRLLILTILFFMLLLNATANSVQKNETITFRAKNIKLREVFKEIKKQTGYSLMYSNKKVSLNLDERVTVNFNKSMISDVMKYLLRGKNLQWQIDDESILIFLGNIEPKQSSLQSDTSVVIPMLQGKVTDAEGKPIAGASISINSTSLGTSTDINGDFKLSNIRQNSTMLVRSIGFETRELPVRGTSILVKLNVVVSELDETMVIAYGSTTKRYATGNISSVKSKDIEKQVITNPLQALQGRVPGIFITQNSSVPGGGITVRIQGQNSITNGNDPLYLIDGVPINSQLPSTTNDYILGNSGPDPQGALPNSGNPLNYINVNDIESIEVLKDADATAIYGSRAANGAILITTKRGKPGKIKTTVNLQTGWAKVARKINMLNARQYLDMRYEGLRNDNIQAIPDTYYDLLLWDTTRSTDWQKTLIGNTAHYTNANASVSGGSKASQFLISTTYNKETTVFALPNDFNNRRGTVHLNFGSTSNGDKFKIQFSGNYMLSKSKLPSADLTQKAIMLEPVAPPLYTSDGQLNWALNSAGTATFDNPLASMYAKYENSTTNLVSNLQLNYKLLSKLELGSSFGYTSMQTEDYMPIPYPAIRPDYRGTLIQRQATYGERDISSWIIEPQIKYNSKIYKGVTDILIGATLLNNSTKGGLQYASGFNSDEVLENKLAASNMQYVYYFKTNYKYNAVFGRFNYTLQDKYVINLSMRRDGSSRFGSANQFHNFWSAAGAWIFSSEHFSPGLLSFGKLRVSYGTSGNDQIADYRFLSLFSPMYNVQVPYQGATSMEAATLANPYLQWEKTNKFQTGLDVGLFKDRVLLNAVFSINTSSNQLVDYSLPSFTGFQSVLSNFPATVRNRTWEFSGTTINIIKKSFKWSTNFNITVPKNKLTKFENLESSTYANRLFINQPLNTIRTIRLLNVNPETGEYQFIDKENKPTQSPAFPADYYTFINPNPKFYGGIENNISYKNLELTVNFQFVKQVGKNFYFNNGALASPGEFRNGYSNQPAFVLDRWRAPGEQASIQAYHSVISPWNTFSYLASGSNVGYSDASYVRLKNISLSWTLPDTWIKRNSIERCRVFAQAQNLLTFTSYRGLDPENQTLMTLPPLKVITVGLNVNF